MMMSAFYWLDHHVRLVGFLSVNSLKQQSAGRHVASHGHIILIPGRHVASHGHIILIPNLTKIRCLLYIFCP